MVDGTGSSVSLHAHSAVPQRTATGLASEAATADTSLLAGSKTESLRSSAEFAGLPSAYPATASTTYGPASWAADACREPLANSADGVPPMASARRPVAG